MFYTRCNIYDLFTARAFKRYIQFLFSSEADLTAVLRRGPWVFNDWFVALQRWADFPRDDFLTFIDLWVQVRGIPLPYVSETVVRFIANTLGEVVNLDFNEETTTQIEFIRVQIRIEITDRLRFFRKIFQWLLFEKKEEAPILTTYMKRVIHIKVLSYLHTLLYPSHRDLLLLSLIWRSF
ncbi:uncharacterized protein At4g02000-like [Capsella rubella]|uniref:uncharacterized protein At4g02000-like n=1 Tax=Capsella rubella TaxID=81985 RepID=UPI000CD51001|nr:uncharacterized protein At4g02000-like [Capsella rubella]